jgi:hypothetical protein
MCAGLVISWATDGFCNHSHRDGDHPTKPPWVEIPRAYVYIDTVSGDRSGHHLHGTLSVREAAGLKLHRMPLGLTAKGGHWMEVSGHIAVGLVVNNSR